MTRTTSLGWIEAARSGDPAALDRFAFLYQDPVRAYVLERWRGQKLVAEVDDAVQQVFVECLRSGGALERFDAGCDKSFRAFLFGVARNVCLRLEDRERLRAGEGGLEDRVEEVEAREERLSVAFDRAWARSVVRAAVKLQEDQARTLGSDALRRVEILRLRFSDDLPVRAIAEHLGLDPVHVHHEYAKARAEFREALIEVIPTRRPRSRAEAESECEEVLALLG